MNSGLMRFIQSDRDLFDWIAKLHDEFWKDPLMQFNRNWRPMDVTETDKEIRIEVELPRFKREEIKVIAEPGLLRIQANNTNRQFARELRLQDCDPSSATVRLEDGVLYVTIPKDQNAQPKQLPIG